jgi:hypothetical protein
MVWFAYFELFGGKTILGSKKLGKVDGGEH